MKKNAWKIIQACTGLNKIYYYDSHSYEWTGFLKLDQVRMQVFNEKYNIPERKIVHC